MLASEIKKPGVYWLRKNMVAVCEKRNRVKHRITHDLGVVITESPGAYYVRWDAGFSCCVQKQNVEVVK